jgi:hypothetical protein
MPLLGRRVQIAGSASAKTDRTLVSYAHDIVRNVVKGVMDAGGGIVVGVGREPRPEGAAPDAPSLVFDWTALEVVAECLKKGFPAWPAVCGLPVVVASSEKAESEIPDSRQALYDELLQSGRLAVESIMPGSRAAAFLRQSQAKFGDALVVIGGGTGVEHLADLYLSTRKPVVPLDLPVGASRDDGTGGALRLSKEARAEPGRFFRFDDAHANSEGAALAGIATRNGAVAASEIALRTAGLITKLTRPAVFYVRLLNPKHPKFPAVEAFFRSVVDHVVDQAGMRRIESGTDRSEHPFMNVAIFESLHFASVAIVDVTGERPNCFIELGYGLRGGRVLATAEEGTPIPFDTQAVPCHFWRASESETDARKRLAEFWEKNVNRPLIVKG